MHASGKSFGKICPKAIRDIFFSNTWPVIRGGIWEPNFLVGVISSRRGKFKLLDLQGDPPQFLPLVRHPDLPIRKTLRRVLGLLTIITLKRVRESIFFQSSKFTACAVKYEKEGANSLMAFNLRKIIHLFQGKKHLRT